MQKRAICLLIFRRFKKHFPSKTCRNPKRKTPLATQVSIAVALLGVCFMLATGFYLHFAAKDCWYNTATAAMMYQVKQSWNSGQIGRFLSQSFVALRVKLECDTRCQIARPYLDRMVTLERGGDWGAALVECAKASQIIGSCDVEGSFDYMCNVLEMKLILPMIPMSTPLP